MKKALRLSPQALVDEKEGLSKRKKKSREMGKTFDCSSGERIPRQNLNGINHG